MSIHTVHMHTALCGIQSVSVSVSGYVLRLLRLRSVLMYAQLKRFTSSGRPSTPAAVSNHLSISPALHAPCSTLLTWLASSASKVFQKLALSARILIPIPGFTAHIATNGRCYIGLKHFISIPIIAYDLYASQTSLVDAHINALTSWLNVMLTVLFVVPLWRLHIVNLAVKSIAHRSLIASTICLTASTVRSPFSTSIPTRLSA